jgi:uncharacterized protein YjbK
VCSKPCDKSENLQKSQEGEQKTYGLDAHPLTNRCKRVSLRIKEEQIHASTPKVGLIENYKKISVHEQYSTAEAGNMPFRNIIFFLHLTLSYIYIYRPSTTSRVHHHTFTILLCNWGLFTILLRMRKGGLGCNWRLPLSLKIFEKCRKNFV